MRTRQARLAVVFAVAFGLAGCSSDFGKFLPIDGRMLQEINSDVVIGAIYYEDPLRDDDEPVSLQDLCIPEVDAATAPKPRISNLAGATIEVSQDANASAGGSANTPFFSLAQLQLGADAEKVEEISIRIRDVQKIEYSHSQLAKIREQLLSPEADCERWLQGIVNSGRPIYQIKGLYRASFKVEVRTKSVGGAQIDAKAQKEIEAKVAGRLQDFFHSQQEGEANLIAVGLLSQDEWAIFDKRKIDLPLFLPARKLY